MGDVYWRKICSHSSEMPCLLITLLDADYVRDNFLSVAGFGVTRIKSLHRLSLSNLCQTLRLPWLCNFCARGRPYSGIGAIRTACIVLSIGIYRHIGMESWRLSEKFGAKLIFNAMLVIHSMLAVYAISKPCHTCCFHTPAFPCAF